MIENSNDSGQPWRKILTSGPLLALLPALPLLVTLYFDLLYRQGDLAPCVAMRLEGARRTLSGEIPYLDFWDWSQPIVLLLVRLPLQLQQFFEQLHMFFRLESITKILVWILVLLSFALCQFLLYKASKQTASENISASVIEQASRLQMPFAIGMALANYSARFQFGDVQHLFIISFMPYLLLRWLRYGGIIIDRRLAIATGAFAGLGISLDLCYWPILIISEVIWLLYFKCRPRGKWEAYGLLGGLALALLQIWLLSSAQKDAFFKWIMPLRFGSLMVFDRALMPYGNAPDRRDFVYLLSVAIIVAAPLARRMPLYQNLISLSLFGLLLFIQEAQGLSYQLVISSFSAVLLLSLAVLDLLIRWQHFLIKNVIVWTLAMTIVSSCFAYKLQQNSRSAFETAYALPATQTKDNLQDIFQAIEKHSKWKDNIILLSYSPNAIYPIVTNLERRQCGYLLWTEPFYLLTQLEERGLLNDDLKDFRKVLVQKIQNDIGSGQAKIILVDQMREEETLDKYKLKKLLADTYDYTDNCLYYSNCQEPRENIGMDLPFLIYEQKHRINPGKSAAP